MLRRGRTGARPADGRIHRHDDQQAAHRIGTREQEIRRPERRIPVGLSRCEHLLDLGRLPNARKHFRAFGLWASTGDFALAAIAVRALCTTSAAKASFRAAQSVKQRLRPIIYEKRPAKTGRAPRPWLGRTRSPATGCNHYKVRNS